jgi:cell division protease FtsH
MLTPLEQYAADHRRLLDVVARSAGIADPVAFVTSSHHWPLLKAATKSAAVPLDGMVVHDWHPANRKVYPGLALGIRLYAIDGIRFASVQCIADHNANDAAVNFLAVGRKDYRRLYRIAYRLLRDGEGEHLAPILPAEQADNLWDNTVGFLESERLRRLQQYGGRTRRGVLLSGPPGNGKTMACRWIWEECRRRNWEYRVVTPNTYRQARRGCDPETAVRALFTVQRRGVIFFDDMDLALRDREGADETEDQAVFLTALDGIDVREGVVYVFTTNCPLDRIDRAFKRPGRIDLALHFGPPDGALRRRLMARWHADMLADLDLDAAVAQTAGFSFAEIEELRNLMIMRYADTGDWNWAWALEQFSENREDLKARIGRSLGFAMPARQESYCGGENYNME